MWRSFGVFISLWSTAAYTYGINIPDTVEPAHVKMVGVKAHKTEVHAQPKSVKAKTPHKAVDTIVSQVPEQAISAEISQETAPSKMRKQPELLELKSFSLENLDQVINWIERSNEDDHDHIQQLIDLHPELLFLAAQQLNSRLFSHLARLKVSVDINQRIHAPNDALANGHTLLTYIICRATIGNLAAVKEMVVLLLQLGADPAQLDAFNLNAYRAVAANSSDKVFTTLLSILWPYSHIENTPLSDDSPLLTSSPNCE